MDNSVNINFGTPKNGWLPVDLSYGDFHIDFDASDVINDPINELCEILLGLQNNKSGEILWWLEPGAYFFGLQKVGSTYSLTISLTNDLHSDESENHREVEKIITGDHNQIVIPFLKAIKKFCSQSYETVHWPYNLDKDKIGILLADTNA
jgi:hypothetical protein